jgi:hypothetical protein
LFSIPVFGQVGPANHDIGSGLAAAQKKAVTAANAYADVIANSRESAQHSAIFRSVLNRAYAQAIISSPQALNEVRIRAREFDADIRAIVGGTPVGVEPAFPAPTISIPTLIKPNALDNDARYRANQSALTSGSGQESNRIWGGMLALGYANTVAVTDGTALCTGTVIARNAVLTAQHCFCAGMAKSIYIGNVLDGLHAPYANVTSGKSMKPCSSVVTDPADVAILFVSREFDPRVIIPAVLASKGMIDGAKVVRAVGFGETETGVVGQKMIVDIAVATDDCAGTLHTASGTLTDAQYYHCNKNFELVAGAPLLNKDTCNGDSGGPIFVRDTHGNDFLAGATSRAVGIPDSRNCGDGGIYVRTDGIVESWIASQGIHMRTGA